MPRAAEMEQGGVLDDEDMDLEEQGPTKVVKEMVSQQRGGWGGGWKGAALWVGYPEQGPTQCGEGLRGAGTNQGGQGNGEATRCVCFRAEDVTSERREAKLSALTNLLSMLADHTGL